MKLYHSDSCVNVFIKLIIRINNAHTHIYCTNKSHYGQSLLPVFPIMGQAGYSSERPVLLHPTKSAIILLIRLDGLSLGKLMTAGYTKW